MLISRYTHCTLYCWYQIFSHYFLLKRKSNRRWQLELPEIFVDCRLLMTSLYIGSYTVVKFFCSDYFMTLSLITIHLHIHVVQSSDFVSATLLNFLLKKTFHVIFDFQRIFQLCIPSQTNWRYRAEYFFGSQIWRYRAENFYGR